MISLSFKLPWRKSYKRIAPQPALEADDIQVLLKAGFQLPFGETTRMIQKRLRIDRLLILAQTALDFFRSESDSRAGETRETARQ